MSPCTHLDRSRLARKCAKPVGSRVSGQVDQDIDLVGSDTIRQSIVGPLQNASPPIGYITEGISHFVLARRAGIANDLESRFVVVLQHRPERICGRMVLELGRNVTQDNPSGRIAIILVWRRVLYSNLRPNLAPPLGSRCLIAHVVAILAEIQREDPDGK